MNARQRLIAEKIVAMSQYSIDGIPKCAKCGDTRYIVLDFHHIGGKGNEHRREIGRTSLARWLKEQGYPDGYSVLCANCHRIQHGGEIIIALDELEKEMSQDRPTYAEVGEENVKARFRQELKPLWTKYKPFAKDDNHDPAD